MPHAAVSRVEAFIADFHAAWERSGSVPMMPFNPFTAAPGETFDVQAWAQSLTPPDIATWERELAQLVDEHFMPGARTGSEGKMSGKPDHRPDLERVSSVEAGERRSIVRTVLEDRGVPVYYEYRLVLADDGWRIGKLVASIHPPDVPLVSPDEMARALAGVRDDVPHAALPAGSELDLPSLFTGPREVVGLGEITTSGVLTVLDLGWAQQEALPLTRHVPAGSHPVEVARDGVTNVALRLRLSDLPAAAWHPAERVGRAGIVDVDAGNVAIADYAALAATAADRVDEIFQDESDRIVTSPGVVFSIGGGRADTVMVASGYGDGSYPAYWGVAADGSLTELVVDFLVAVEDITTTITIPWRVGPTSDAVLAEHDFEILIDGDLVLFGLRQAVDERLVRQAEVRGPDGEPVPGQDRGSFVQGEVSQWRWRPDAGVPEGSTVQVTVSHGYRHV